MKVVILVFLVLFSPNVVLAYCSAYCISVTEYNGNFFARPKLNSAEVRKLQKERVLIVKHYAELLSECDESLRAGAGPELDKSAEGVLVQFNNNGDLIPATVRNSCEG